VEVGAGAPAVAGAPFVDNDYCFACGTRNPLGLHLKFAREGELYVTRVRPLPHWQGWEHVMHGGLQATIMDDLMSNHLFQVCRVFAVTAEMRLRFRRPVPLGAELRFTSRLGRHSGRVWELVAACTTVAEPETVLSEATGRFLQVPQPSAEAVCH
jgi:hypothetical protein